MRERMRNCMSVGNYVGTTLPNIWVTLFKDLKSFFLSSRTYKFKINSIIKLIGFSFFQGKGCGTYWQKSRVKRRVSERQMKRLIVAEPCREIKKGWTMYLRYGVMAKKGYRVARASRWHTHHSIADSKCTDLRKNTKEYGRRKERL